MRTKYRITAIAIAAMALGTALAPPASERAFAQDRLAEKGRQISQAHCSRCHVVDPDNRMVGISSTPSFMILIKALDDWRERFATFHARLPHPAHVRFEGDAPRPIDLPATTEEVILKIEDIEAIVAYAEALADDVKE
ncbi:hypothetical protein HPQ64_12260 [Rhizobiales bacterium]|uniref:hypothetical protein n=1 Tax=Hongsoonwoonella zoysiae TaxID=2821844 RepID=UPI00156056EF|nr:hypothetical protein [Hongsoonwoonella zoysiae]NRG18464.1 hypothetical protein [Hongsoonwoonella zoysiae]